MVSRRSSDSGTVSNSGGRGFKAAEFGGSRPVRRDGLGLGQGYLRPWLHRFFCCRDRRQCHDSPAASNRLESPSGSYELCLLVWLAAAKMLKAVMPAGTHRRYQRSRVISETVRALDTRALPVPCLRTRPPATQPPADDGPSRAPCPVFWAPVPALSLLRRRFVFATKNVPIRPTCIIRFRSSPAPWDPLFALFFRPHFQNHPHCQHFETLSTRDYAPPCSLSTRPYPLETARSVSGARVYSAVSAREK